MLTRIYPAIIICLLFFGVADTHAQLNSNGLWTFMKGDSAVPGYPYYGTKGLASPDNKPGARIGNISWKDNNGKLWIFGGRGLAHGSPGTLFINYAFLSDLWKYDPATNEWTWVNGSDGQNKLAVFGQKGVPDINNKPGSRLTAAASWTDASGNFWMFGGYGYSSSGEPGLLSDVWKYDLQADTWTWMHGNTATDQSGVYGTQYIASPSNKMGGRTGAASAVDEYNNVWIYGGDGKPRYSTTQTILNDLWKYNTVTNEWTWMGGGEIVARAAIYGTRGIENNTNNPGSRRDSKTWFDHAGNMWLYGGYGISQQEGCLSDLWRFNTSTLMWTWIAGDSLANTQPVYGTIGITSPSVKPGGRYNPGVFPDSNYVYVLGGSTTGSNYGYINDLWRLDMNTFEWTWLKGSDREREFGNYGEKGIPHPDNKPGARELQYCWNDDNGNLWFLGGTGQHLNTTQQNFPHDDLWQFNTVSNNFTWMHGNNALECMGQFGTKHSAALSNKPGARSGANAWTDSAGNFWLFGGSGYPAAVSNKIAQDNLTGNLNDMWKYDPATNQWTWMQGDDSVYRQGVYGQRGVFNPANTPGGRYSAASAKGDNGHFYLAGGFCHARNGWMNDLWEFDPAINQWRWLSGDSVTSRQGIYGTQGTAASTNKPGGRRDAAAWTDNAGNFWLFGGQGWDVNGSFNELNDLWKYDITTDQWTWMKGSNLVTRFSTTVPTATTGTSDIANTPGGRFFCTPFKDNAGNLWLYGGVGRSFGSPSSTNINELWKYDPVTNMWTWVKGTTTMNSAGVYGTQGVAAAANLPGARTGSCGWKDLAGNFWILGGRGRGESGSGTLNDLWKYDLPTNQWTWVKGDKTVDQYGVYGTPGVAGTFNKIGNRLNSATWVDKTGNLWVFAGTSSGGTFSNNLNPLVDLWKFGNYQPPTEICSGSNTTLTANIPGANLHWQLSTDNVNFADIADNVNYSGTTSATLQIITPPASWNGYKYRLKSSSDSSNIFTIFINAVNPSPSVSITASAITFTQGEQITFIATAQNAGNSPAYQWQVNGINTGSDSDTLRLSDLSGVDSVRVIVTGALSCANSNIDTSDIIVMTQVGRLSVEFANKAGNNYSLDHPELFLSARALEKRQRFNIPIDSTDLPVNERYIDSIRMAGNVTVTGISKWLNTITIQTTDANAINKINNFSFVKNIAGLAPRNAATGTTANKFEEITAIPDNSEETPSTELANIYNYGQTYGQVHLHQGEFLHNHGFSGQGMQLAMMDAGFPNYNTLAVFDSVRLNNRFLGTWDFVNNNANVNGFNSHGTQCLSIIASHVPSTIVGTAPKTSFYLYRTEDAATEYPIEEQNMAVALERADSLGVDVASISLGYSEFTDPSLNYTYSDMDGNTSISAKAADLAARKGMLVVVAAGNEGAKPWHYLLTPSDADSVLSVGAVDISGNPGNFSSYGPSSDGQVKPGVAAMGVAAVVANPSTGTPMSGNGTSFACPNMAGLATCLWQAFPESINMGIISALQEAATIYNAPDDRIGYGIPDMKKAFVILLKRAYTQDIKQAGCNVSIKWTGKSSGNMNFVVERKLPTDVDYLPIHTQNGSGDFANGSFSFSDDLSALAPPISISYRIKMNIDTDTSFYFTPVVINHQNTCNTYTFTGDGNWNVAANWAGNNMPPANLPAGSTIIIDPVISGECILNTTQQIQAGGYIEVKAGKKMTVQGNLIIQ